MKTKYCFYHLSLKFTHIKTFDHISPIDLMVGMCFKQNLSNIEKVFHVMAFDISVCVLYFESSAILRKWMITVQLKFSSIYLVIS